MKLQSILFLLAFLTPLSASAEEIDLKASSFTWKGTKVTGAHEGVIFPKSGSVVLQDGKLQSGEVVMDLTRFTVTDLEGEWADKLLGHLKSDDFFNISKFPEAKLVFNRVENGTVSGDLTIKGKTHPVKFRVTEKGGKYSGVLKFDRTKFGMVYNSGNFFKDLGDKMIDDEVSLNFAVVIKR